MTPKRISHTEHSMGWGCSVRMGPSQESEGFDVHRREESQRLYNTDPNKVLPTPQWMMHTVQHCA